MANPEVIELLHLIATGVAFIIGLGIGYIIIQALKDR